MWEKSIRSLTRGGRPVTTGGTAAYDVNMNVYVFHKELRPLGAHSTTKHELDVLQMSLIAAGYLRPVVDRVFPLAEAVGPTALWPPASTSARSSSASSTDQHARARVANRRYRYRSAAARRPFGWRRPSASRVTIRRIVGLNHDHRGMTIRPPLPRMSVV